MGFLDWFRRSTSVRIEVLDEPVSSSNHQLKYVTAYVFYVGSEDPVDFCRILADYLEEREDAPTLMGFWYVGPAGDKAEYQVILEEASVKAPVK